MIDKKKAKKAGCGIRESEESFRESKQVKIEQIKSILPDLINNDGQLNIDTLRNHLGIESLNKGSQGYGLNFAGKGLACIKTDVPTKLELHAEFKQSKNFKDTENIIIRGDNLDALKILRQNYEDKVKMIYIDPPYNTQSDDFLYKDDFKVKEIDLIEKYGIDADQVDFFQNIFATRSHSGWLYFMYPRLCLARDLLREDGVIFISIDDHEQSNLKIMCDEIFGVSNTTVMIWHKVGDGNAGAGKMKNVDTFRVEHEYIIICYKDKRKVKFSKPHELPNFKNHYNNLDNDPRGPYKAGNMSKSEEKSKVNGKNYYSVTAPSGREFTRQWHFDKEKFLRLEKEKRICWGKSGNAVPRIKIFLNQTRAVTPTSILYEKGSATIGNKENEKFFGTKIFNNPKPLKLLHYLIEIACPLQDKDSIILDFFAGSGTTAEAVMKLNQEDGGNRKFILVQWDEEINSKKNAESYVFCKENDFNPVISSICIERINRAGKKIIREIEKGKLSREIEKGKLSSEIEKGKLSSEIEKGKLSNAMLDIGYKVFSLIEKPNLRVDRQQLSLRNQRANTYDILYNMISISGKYPLTVSITEIEKDLLYEIGESLFVLGKCKKDISEFQNHCLYIDGYADIDIMNWFNLLELRPLDNDKNERVKILY